MTGMNMSKKHLPRRYSTLKTGNMPISHNRNSIHGKGKNRTATNILAKKQPQTKE